MKLFRLAKSAFAKDLSGKGAQLSGGRWNSKGLPVVYTGSSRALCVAEIAAHTPLGMLPTDYCLTVLQVPVKSSLVTLAATYLPENWQQYPPGNETQLLGDQWLRSTASLLLKVPSAVVEGEFNFLLNPQHPEIQKVALISCEPFQFNPRLFLD